MFSAPALAGFFLGHLIGLVGIGGLVLGLLQTRWVIALVAGLAVGFADPFAVTMMGGSPHPAQWIAGVAAGVVAAMLGFAARKVAT